MKMNLCFEAVPHCPLTCPSCPQGRREIKRSSAMLQPDALAKMLRILADQTPINRITFSNYSEPLLHRHLPDLIQIAKPYGRVQISTSGDRWICDLKDLAWSQPENLTVTLSGMSQHAHALTRPGGHWSQSIQFIEKMSRYGALGLCIFYHRYRHTLDDEKEARRFARDMGVPIHFTWGTQLGQEALIAGDSNKFQMVSTRDQLTIARGEPDHQCSLQVATLGLRHDGTVVGCATAASQEPVGNVFNDSLETIMANKRSFKLCGPCYKTHAYKLACGQSIGVDKRFAEVADGSLIDRLRWFVERAKKRIWVRQESPIK